MRACKALVKPSVRRRTLAGYMPGLGETSMLRVNVRPNFALPA